MSNVATPWSTVELLASRVEYNPDTGDLVWKYVEECGKTWNARWAGKRAGSPDRKGYLRVCVSVQGKPKMVAAHRLAFFIVHGRLPLADIDHINGNPADNRASNLREVSRALNHRNRKPSDKNTSGFVGVRQARSGGKWTARGKIHGKEVHLGVFNSKEEAATEAAGWRELRGYSPRHLSIKELPL